MCVFVLSRVFYISMGFWYVQVHVGLWWPELVPNQRQLLIVVSDWGSYLGCHFPFWFCGLLSMCSCMSALVVYSGTFGLLFLVSLFKCSSCFSLIKEECILITLYSNHAAPWSHRYDDRDKFN
jgi:hypothetical protein